MDMEGYVVHLTNDTPACSGSLDADATVVDPRYGRHEWWYDAGESSTGQRRGYACNY